MRKIILRIDIVLTMLSLISIILIKKIPYLSIVLFFSLGIQIIRCIYGTIACILNNFRINTSFEIKKISIGLFLQ